MSTQEAQDLTVRKSVVIDCSPELAFELLTRRSAEPLAVPVRDAVTIAIAAAPFPVALDPERRIELERVLEGGSSHQLNLAE